MRPRIISRNTTLRRRNWRRGSATAALEARNTVSTEVMTLVMPLAMYQFQMSPAPKSDANECSVGLNDEMIGPAPRAEVLFSVRAVFSANRLGSSQSTAKTISTINAMTLNQRPRLLAPTAVSVRAGAAAETALRTALGRRVVVVADMSRLLGAVDELADDRDRHDHDEEQGRCG